MLTEQLAVERVNGPVTHQRIAESDFFATLRTREFARLDADDHAYLDYTGSALYPDSLVASHTAMLRNSVLGNPHSDSRASLSSSALIAEAKARLLRFLDADAREYTVCFTTNASTAIGLVAESFAFGAHTPLVLSVDNHNSVNGIREYALRAGAPVHYLPLDAELRLDQPVERLRVLSEGRGGLFAFPAQSNFSGVRHSLSLVREAQALGLRVLLDAAAFVPTSRLSLREIPADFVALSFYKMFGYPTGVGALVARTESLAELRRPWFAGGTVEFVSVQHGIHAMRDGGEAFEDGTANFLSIGAIPAGIDYLERVGVDRIEHRASWLALRLIRELEYMRHANGAPLARVYGPATGERRGATVAFNVVDESGVVIPYQVVEERARDARVSVRGGCFCNPGAAEAAFAFPSLLTRECLLSAHASGWSITRFAECMQGVAVGAVRASFGAASDARDLERLLSIVRSFARKQKAK